MLVRQSYQDLRVSSRSQETECRLGQVGISPDITDASEHGFLLTENQAFLFVNSKFSCEAEFNASTVVFVKIDT